jgi:hypothetical protein
MSADFVTDLDIVDQTTVEVTGSTYPVAQWLHGDPKLAAAGGVAHTGGIILPAKYLDEGIAPAPGWSRTTVGFSSGKSESVLAAQKPRLAVIRTRFRWFVVYNGVTTFYPRSGYVAESGMRGHVQALCGIHGFDFPIVVTFKGKASQEFERLLREFSQKVQEAANRVSRDKGASGGAASAVQNRPAPGSPRDTAPGIARGMAPGSERGTAPGSERGTAPGSARGFPRFAFYMRLAPGPHIKVGQKGQESIITPPVVELPNVVTEEYLTKIYVGRDRLLGFQQTYHDGADWAAAWDRPGAEETVEEHELESAPADVG